MGGLHSGRTRRHTCIDDCFELDTAWLRKQKIFDTPHRSISIQWKKWTETNFAKRKERSYFVQAHYQQNEDSERPTLTLAYQAVLTYDDYRPKQEHSYSKTISLESTPCNYGGVRWWFLAPCCGNRVRVLYINPKGGDLERITPQCRDCLDLHYASQQQSYIERHKTYERHLLANYGYAWAEMEYQCLREHYQEITPELAWLKERSILQMRMKLLRPMMAFTRLILRMHIHNLRRIKSEADRRLYYDHVVKEHGESYGLDLVHMLGISIQMERDGHEASSDVFDNQAIQQLSKTIAKNLENEDALDPETEKACEEVITEQTFNLRFLLAYKSDLEENIKHLERQQPAA